MNAGTIAAMAADPAAFRRSLTIDCSPTPRRLGEVIEPWQDLDFRALDPAWKRVAGLLVEGGPRRAYLERGRGHSKTLDLANASLWAILFANHPVSGIAAAADKDQAKLLVNAIGRLVALNEWTTSRISVQNYRVVNTHSGSQLEILSCDAASSYGQTPDFVLCDELVHWSEEAGERLWHSLFSAASKCPHCLLVIISNAGFGRGTSWQWSVREKARTRDDWYFWRLDGPQASWITPATLDEQRDLLPEKVWRRLFYNEWSDDKGDLLRSADIEASITLPGPAARREPGHNIVIGGVDIGITRDSSAVVVLAGNLTTQRVSLLNARSWSPREYAGEVPINLVEKFVREMQATYSLDAVIFDSWQFERSAQQLVAEGLNMKRWTAAPANQDNMARTLLQLFYERRVDMYRDHLLLRDLAKLSIVERAKKLKIEAPHDADGHCDLAMAFSIAAPLVLDVRHSRAYEEMYDGPMMVVPY